MPTLILVPLVSSGCISITPLYEIESKWVLSGDDRYRCAHIVAKKPSDDGAFVISKDCVTLSLGGSSLVSANLEHTPDQFTGRAIVVRNAKNVTIKGGYIAGYKVAIYAENCPCLKIENCDVSNNFRQRLKSTPQREDESDWLYGHENDSNEWLRYGAGIYLYNCEGATIKNCKARNGQNGICLVRCDKATVVGCDMSFMSGWGLALWRSCFCKVIGNRFDYCVRGYSHGVYARGQDSAGILVYEQCSDNVFAYNHATHGGDGFFLYAGNETVKKTGEGGCNRNLVYMNDFSYAVANGIEATFSDQNIFLKNLLTNCEHGVWGGYSTRSRVVCNTIEDCKNGVSIEHGRENAVVQNDLIRCGRGAWLWWDDDKDLLASPYCKKRGGDSTKEAVLLNHFDCCATAINARDNDKLEISGNTFGRCDRVLTLAGRASVEQLHSNSISDGIIENHSSSLLNGIGNYVSPTVKTSGAIRLENAAPGPVVVSESMKPDDFFGRALMAELKPWIIATSIDSKTPVLGPGPPHRMSTKPLGPLPGIPEGKQFILVNKWGPYDFSQPEVFPKHSTAWGSTVVQVLGKGEPFKVVSASGGVTVTPASGKTPATVTICAGDAKTSYIPFKVTFQVGDKKLATSGELLSAEWAVNYYKWDAANDPRDGELAWKHVRSAEPILREKTKGIDFVWGAGGPTPLTQSPRQGPTPEVTDHFALVATTDMTLPAGKWRLRMISDDGVRVYVGIQRAIDNWTWHVPTENTAEITLSGKPEKFRIEYFEIDGHAQLQFFVEPVSLTEQRP